MCRLPFPSRPSLPSALQLFVQLVYCNHNADGNRPSVSAELTQITGRFISGVQNALGDKSSLSVLVPVKLPLV
jgi:hypothetical protein